MSPRLRKIDMRPLKGLSTGAVIGIAAAVAVAIVALTVLLVVMNHGSSVSQPSVKPIGKGQMICVNGEYQVNVELNSSVFTKVISAYIEGTNVKDNAIYYPSINPGENSLTICFPVNNAFTPVPGHSYYVVLELSNGQTVTVPVVYEGEEPTGAPTVTQVGEGTMYYNSSLNKYVVEVELRSTAPVTIVSAAIVGTSIQIPVNYTLTFGVNTVTMYFPTSSSFSPQQGSTYIISLGLSDGTVVQVAVTYVGSS